MAVGSAETQVKSRFGAAERKPAPGGHEQGGSWQLAVQKRRKSQGLELVSSRFGK